MSIKTICYLSFGYPTIEKSIEMAGRYIEGGCDAIEVSIPPKDPYRDSAFLQELYRVALAQTDDYSKYLEGIGRMTEQYPSTEFFFVLYHVTHVSTQLTYAIVAAAVSFVGYIIAGFVPNALIVLPVTLALLIGVLFVLRFLSHREAK